MMLAQELAVDPLLKQRIRLIFSLDAIISVTPTEKGKKEIQHLHPYYVSLATTYLFFLGIC
jgi:transcription elongation factor SPT6